MTRCSNGAIGSVYRRKMGVAVSNKKSIRAIGSDSGGTMTDIIVVDSEGDFTLGKAPTNNENQGLSFWRSLENATSAWGIQWETEASDYLPDVQSCTYAGTTMLNMLVTRTGKKLGVLCTKGHETSLLHERAKSVCAGYSIKDRIHQATHIHNEPLVKRRNIFGVTERIDSMGNVAIPLYEDEVRESISMLLERDIESIVIWMLFSYANHQHEQRAAEIAREMMAERGLDYPIHLSSEACQIWREIPRLNSTLLLSYAAEGVRVQMSNVENRLAENGFSKSLQILLSSGGLSNLNHSRLQEAAFSGPLGGILGGQFVARELGIKNLVCSDVGGTTFDVGLLVGGEPVMKGEVEMEQMLFNIPTVSMDAIGAGMGMYISIDPDSGRILMSDDSAGSDPGPVCYNKGNTTPTLTDCYLLLGILDPNNHLGGSIELDMSLAYEAVKTQCADPLNINVYEFAEGAIKLVTDQMKEHIKRSIEVRGFSVSDYYLLGYGGGGPMCLAAYSDNVPFKGVFTTPFSSVFSAFGCTTADYVQHHRKSTFLYFPPGMSEEVSFAMGGALSSGWEELEKIALEEMIAEGVPAEKVVLEHVAYVRYIGQMEDLEVDSPVSRIQTKEDLDNLFAVFNDKYNSIYHGTGGHANAGYQIMEFGIKAWTESYKPAIRRYPMADKTPSRSALRGHRKVYENGSWESADIYDLEMLEAGNEISGLSIIESPTSTIYVPGHKKVILDDKKFLWIEDK